MHLTKCPSQKKLCALFLSIFGLRAFFCHENRLPMSPFKILPPLNKKDHWNSTIVTHRFSHKKRVISCIVFVHIQFPRWPCSFERELNLLLLRVCRRPLLFQDILRILISIVRLTGTLPQQVYLLQWYCQNLRFINVHYQII